MKPFIALTILGISLTGCISHHSTVSQNKSRVSVEFENDTAGRLFYEALSLRPATGRPSGSTTVITIPIIFRCESRSEVVNFSDNGKFNDAVAVCDSNQDGKITELEAKIFADQNQGRCVSSTGRPQLAIPRQAQVEDLQARIAATASITAFPKRDEVLASIAKDAAREGDFEDARTALNKITAFPTRDEAIRDSARLLTAAGQRSDALELAKLVTAFPKRDALISELAK